MKLGIAYRGKISFKVGRAQIWLRTTLSSQSRWIWGFILELRLFLHFIFGFLKVIRRVSCTSWCGHQGKHFQRNSQQPTLIEVGNCCLAVTATDYVVNRALCCFGKQRNLCSSINLNLRLHPPILQPRTGTWFERPSTRTTREDVIFRTLLIPRKSAYGERGEQVMGKEGELISLSLSPSPCPAPFE